MDMLDSVTGTPTSMSAADKQRVGQRTLARSSVVWIQTISIMSVVNAVAILAGAKLRLAVGLAFTDLAVAMAMEAGGVALALAIIALIGVAGGMYLLAWLFKKTGRMWIAIVVVVFYALDILPSLLTKSYISVGFHVVAIFGIIQGLQAFRALQKEQAASAGAQAVAVQVREVRVQEQPVQAQVQPQVAQAAVVQAPVQPVVPAVPAVPAGWYSDPSGRHQYRYWDSRQWTRSVLNNGEASVDSAGA